MTQDGRNQITTCLHAGTQEICMPGAIAKNAQEGTRSEYLAQYVLSSFGTAIPVPHPEDSGIDLYCTLGQRVGYRFLVENQYLVQVKSTKDPLHYKGADEVKWLLSHNYPIFLCVVNKTALKIELYQTVALSVLSAKTGIENISLVLENPQDGEYFPTLIETADVTLSLGDPIVRFDVTSLAIEETKIGIANTIKSWVELDQENIGLKETGFTMYRVPASWTPNKPVEALSFVGNFKDNLVNKEARTKFDNLFLKQLSQIVNQWAAEKNIPNYTRLTDFIRFYTTTAQLRSCFGARILQFSINTGNEYLGFPERMSLTEIPDKKNT